MRVYFTVVCLLGVVAGLLGVVSGRTVIQVAHDLHAATFTSLVAKAGLSHQLSSQGQFCRLYNFIVNCVILYHDVSCNQYIVFRE